MSKHKWYEVRYENLESFFLIWFIGAAINTLITLSYKPYTLGLGIFLSLNALLIGQKIQALFDYQWLKSLQDQSSWWQREAMQCLRLVQKISDKFEEYKKEVASEGEAWKSHGEVDDGK